MTDEDEMNTGSQRDRNLFGRKRGCNSSKLKKYDHMCRESSRGRKKKHERNILRVYLLKKQTKIQ